MAVLKVVEQATFAVGDCIINIELGQLIKEVKTVLGAFANNLVGCNNVGGITIPTTCACTVSVSFVNAQSKILDFSSQKAPRIS